MRNTLKKAMKKITVLCTVMMLILGSVTVTTSAATSVGTATGSWKINRSFSNVKVPSSKKKLLAKAVKKDKKTSYRAICYLGSQVVAGTNHLYLCKVKKQGSSSYLAIVTVYQDLDKSVSLASVEKINPGNYCEDRDVEDDLCGGVSVYTKSRTAKLPKTVKKAYNRATKGLCGMDYKPIAYLGSQVVAGTNYSILCLGKGVYPGAETHLYVVTINDRSWEKESSIVSVYGLY